MKTEGFTYKEDPLWPIVKIELHGKELSIKQLVAAAEKMRLELLKHGVGVEVGPKSDGCDK